MDLSSLMAEDAKQGVHLPSDEELKTVGELANEQLRLESLYRADTVGALLSFDPTILELEEALKQKKDKLSNIKEVELPKALESFGMTSITLLDKSVITIKEDVYAGITEEHREAAFEWLEATDNDGIIKNEIKCPFGKGQDAEAKQLAELLSEKGFSFTNVRGVHPQTLKAFVRKQLEDGLPVPTDIFSIHVKKVASIKLPKVK